MKEKKRVGEDGESLHMDMSDPCEVRKVSDFRPGLRWLQPG